MLIAEKGGIQGIIAAMNRHGTQIQILRFSCRALSMLAANDDNKVKIAQEGGTETIVMAKRNNKQDKEIERLAHRALAQLPNAVARGQNNSSVSQTKVLQSTQRPLVSFNT